VSKTKSCFKIIIFTILLAVLFISPADLKAERNSFQNSESKIILTPAQQRLQTKITFSCRELPIETVLMQLAEQAEIDIIKSPKVTGNVTVKVTDVPLEEALKNILAAHDYTYVATESMIRVIPASEIGIEREQIVTRIYRINYTDVKEVASALEKFISKNGEVAVNNGTSTMMVTDTESKIKAIDNFIQEIDRVTPQVLIEVRIYDITSKDRLDVGIDWSAGRSTSWGEDSEDSVPFLSSDTSRTLVDGAHEPFGRGVFSGTTEYTDDTTGQLEFGILNSHININAVLTMQKEDFSSTLLANPRVLVLDNETATFKSVSEYPYEDISDTSQGGEMTTIKFKEVGIELEVTPHITRGEMIKLHIVPKFSVKVSEVAGVPVVDTRETDTIALIKNRQTVVLGGLRKKDISTQINKVPFLGDLPLLGALFKSEGEETITSELIVFITPKIVIAPLLTESEKERLKTTEFEGPEETKTKAQRSKQ